MMARGPDSPPFRLDRSAFHIAVDMQLLFAVPTAWFVPWLPRVLPNVVAIARRHPDRTLLTRFIPPHQPEEASGAWRDYYARWRCMTQDRLDPRLLELVEPLRDLVPPARMLDKSVYSAFADPRLGGALRRKGIETLIVTGGETDVCVAATVMAAVDLGFRVVLPADALCSGSDTTHDALMTLYRQRFSQQIETTSTERVLREWD
jgi:nicotinamidase-related amidase